ncbi:MAG TPA: protease complex subunit PrcB family protein [Firmicutes bacterium]|nr:protease complex subunit PrcB family protein [Bacillota bacterium]
MKKKALIFLAGILTGVILVTAVGFTNLGNITASLAPVRYLISGKEVRPSDQPYYYFNGKVYVPAGLNYAGTVYLPIRFVAESLGLEVQWNGEAQTISISQPDSAVKPSYPRDIPFEIVTKGSAPKEVTSLLDYSIGTELAQSITFGDRTYLIVTRGSQPTGGYGVNIEQVTETDEEVVVKVGYQDPAPGAIVTQAITYPYCIAMIRKTTKPVRFEGKGDVYVPQLYGLKHMEQITAESKGIKLLAPMQSEKGLTVRGVARVFEATVSWRVTDSRGQAKKDGFVTAAVGGPDWGYFAFEIPTEYQQTGARLQVYEASAKDGAPTNMIEIPLDKYVQLVHQ